jgi:hypothetical protein
LVVRLEFLQCGSVFEKRGVDLGDANFVPFIIFALLMGVNVTPQGTEVVVKIDFKVLELIKVACLMACVIARLDLFAVCVDEQLKSCFKIMLFLFPDNIVSKQPAAFSDESVNVGLPFRAGVVLEGEPAGFGLFSSLG